MLVDQLNFYDTCLETYALHTLILSNDIILKQRLSVSVNGERFTKQIFPNSKIDKIIDIVCV